MSVPPVTLLDLWLPRSDFVERHQISIRGSTQQVYAASRGVDFRKVPIIRLLFALRSLPALFLGSPKGQKGLGLTLDEMEKHGFMFLEERLGEEFLIGVVGAFWKPSGQICHLPAAQFKSFDEPGFAKAVWNFRVEEASDWTILSTETRIRCPDDESRRKFGRYWFFIRPFSGLTRIAMLRLIRREVERG